MTENTNNNRLFYTIGEVAKMLEVETSTVRFWENEFSIIKPRRNAKGNRLFTQTDLQNLKQIRHLLRDQRMTIDGAKQAMKDKRDTVERNAELVDRLKNIRDLLVNVRNDLDNHE